MTKDKIGGRSVDITKESGNIKIVFHPLAQNVKHPNAVVFSITLSKSDLDKLKKAFWYNFQKQIIHFQMFLIYFHYTQNMSVSRTDEQSIGSETYGFDAIRGVQANREFYVAMCPLKIIPI